MGKLLPLFIFVIVAVATGQAKPTCNLNLKDSPEIRGIKLGMPENDVNRVLSWKDDGKIRRSKLNRFDYSGIEDVFFDFYKGKLVKAEIQYDRGNRWANEKEYAEMIGNAWNLPLSAWRFDGYTAKITCKEFEIKADAINNRAVLIDTIARKGMADEILTHREAEKKAFKP